MWKRALAIGVVSTTMGCSWSVGSSNPVKSVDGSSSWYAAESKQACKDSTAPVADAVISTMLVAGAVALSVAASSASSDTMWCNTDVGECASKKTHLWTWAAITSVEAMPFAASSVYGFHLKSKCEQEIADATAIAKAKQEHISLLEAEKKEADRVRAQVAAQELAKAEKEEAARLAERDRIKAEHQLELDRLARIQAEQAHADELEREVQQEICDEYKNSCKVVRGTIPCHIQKTVPGTTIQVPVNTMCSTSTMVCGKKPPSFSCD